jgi:hypothetical protein
VIPSHLIELGQQAVAAVAANVVSGEPLVRCQLLASEFYEALKRELRATSELGVVERAMVVAAANQCRHAATASISPGAMLVFCPALILNFLRAAPPTVGRRGGTKCLGKFSQTEKLR